MLVSEVMTASVVIGSLDDSVQPVAALMRELRLHTAGGAVALGAGYASCAA